MTAQTLREMNQSPGTSPPASSFHPLQCSAEFA